MKTNISLLEVDLDLLKTENNNEVRRNNKIATTGLVEIDYKFNITKNIDLYELAKKEKKKKILCIVKGDEETKTILKKMTLQIIKEIKKRESIEGKTIGKQRELMKNLCLAKGTVASILKGIENDS